MNENSLKENTQEIHGFIIAITKVILIWEIDSSQYNDHPY